MHLPPKVQHAGNAQSSTGSGGVKVNFDSLLKTAPTMLSANKQNISELDPGATHERL